MHFSIKNHHICGESTRKNHQKHTTWWQKNKIASVFAPPFVAPSKHHLHNYTKYAPNGQFYKNEKVTIDGRANQWYNSYINEVNHV